MRHPKVFSVVCDDPLVVAVTLNCPRKRHLLEKHTEQDDSSVEDIDALALVTSSSFQILDFRSDLALSAKLGGQLP